MSKLSLTALGAAQEVGRSSFILDYGERVLLDRGVKLFADEVEYPLPVRQHVDAAVISHSHMDHIGALPHLFTQERILSYMTPPTLEISKLLWFDSLKIAAQEAMTPEFSKEEIALTEKFAFPLGYKREVPVSRNCHLTFFDAGHIVGSALSKLAIRDTNFLYTGDLRVNPTRLHNGADLKVGPVDVCVIESTYGDRLHPPRKDVEQEFIRSVREVLENGGQVVVPAFAVNRSQELVELLADARLGVPIFLDGMGTKAARIMENYPKFVENFKGLKNALNQAEFIGKQADRKRALKEPSVVVTTAGMLQGGPVMYYLKHVANDPASALFLTGYQVEGTAGRRVMDEGVMPFEDGDARLECQVRKFDFSGHADQAEMLYALKKWGPRQVVLVHGDAGVMKTFGAKIESELGMEVFMPAAGETLSLG